MTFEFLEGDCRGLKLIGLNNFLYLWKSLGTLMSKMGLHDPFGHLKHKLWPKEGLGVKLTNCQFDSQPLKVGNHPDFLAYR